MKQETYDIISKAIKNGAIDDKMVLDQAVWDGASDADVKEVKKAFELSACNEPADIDIEDRCVNRPKDKFDFETAMQLCTGSRKKCEFFKDEESLVNSFDTSSNSV